INPNYELAHSAYGYYLTLLGQLESGREQLLEAERLEPSKWVIKLLLGHNYFARRDYHNAILQYQKALRFEDSDMPHHFLGRAYQALGQYPDAIKEFEAADLLSGKDKAEIRRGYDGLRKAFNQAGKEGYWQEQLARTAKRPDDDYYWKAVIQI